MKIVIADGADRTWNIADQHFPGAIQVVDIYHARQHLWELARAIETENSELTDKIRIEADYFERNAARMQYPVFPQPAPVHRLRRHRGRLQNRYRPAPQTIRNVLDSPGANPIMALRCHLLSNKFEDYRASRSRADMIIQQKCRTPVHLTRTCFPAHRATIKEPPWQSLILYPPSV